MYNRETEQERDTRLEGLTLEETSTLECAYCRRLRWEYRRYGDSLIVCPRHGADMFHPSNQ